MISGMASLGRPVWLRPSIQDGDDDDGDDDDDVDDVDELEGEANGSTHGSSFYRRGPSSTTSTRRRASYSGSHHSDYLDADENDRLLHYPGEPSGSSAPARTAARGARAWAWWRRWLCCGHDNEVHQQQLEDEDVDIMEQEEREKQRETRKAMFAASAHLRRKRRKNRRWRAAYFFFLAMNAVAFLLAAGALFLGVYLLEAGYQDLLLNGASFPAGTFALGLCCGLNCVLPSPLLEGLLLIGICVGIASVGGVLAALFDNRTGLVAVTCMLLTPGLTVSPP